MRQGMGKRIVTKEDAAKAQLERAIKCYRERDWICALTLAGAAEEILPRGKTLDLFVAVVTSLGRHGLEKKLAITVFNSKRNWLKHATESDPGPKKIGPADAAIMIVRAMTRFYAATGKQTAAMNSFERLFRKRYRKWMEGR
jgi:hypothetical protein